MCCYHCAVESYECARVQVVAGRLRVWCQLHPACSLHLHRFEQLNYMTSVSWRHPGALQSLRTEARAFEFVCVGKSGLVSSVAVRRVTVVCVGLVWISDGDQGTNCATVGGNGENIGGLIGRKWRETGENCIMRNFMIGTAYQILLGSSGHRRWDGRGM